MSHPARESAITVLGRIALSVAMIVGIILGVAKGFDLLVPAQWCIANRPNSVAFVVIIVISLQIAMPQGRQSVGQDFRLGTTMLAGLIVAELVTRTIAGCTPVAGWRDPTRDIVQIFVMAAILIPLAHLHREVIEPRWSGRPARAREEQE